MQDIFIGESGKGFPLVLVHGFLGSNVMWGPQIDFFKNKYRVLTPSLPGFGKSKYIDSCDSIECMAKAILDSLDKKEVGKFNLLGHSMGGMVVQEMVKLAGDKIQKLILYGTGPIGSMPGRFETIEESRKRLKESGLHNTANRIAKTWFVNGDKAKYFYICSKAGKETSLKAADNALLAMKNWSGLDDLKYIKNETLIIWGDKDKAYNFNQVETLKNNISDSLLKVIKDCSHNVHLENPERFNSCVEEFLK